MALVNMQDPMAFDALWVMHILSLLVETIEETIGLDKMREHSDSLTKLLDTMIDYGYPNIVDKPVLAALIQPPSSATLALIDKVMAAGSVIDRYSNILHSAVMGTGK